MCAANSFFASRCDSHHSHTHTHELLWAFGGCKEPMEAQQISCSTKVEQMNGLCKSSSRGPIGWELKFNLEGTVSAVVLLVVIYLIDGWFLSPL